MTRLLVEASNALCQLQDGGRFGVRHLGVTQGGALDWEAQYWANWLLGNPLDAAVVEVTLGGLTLKAEADCTLAIGGADLDARLDDQPVNPWRSFVLRKGQRLSFKQPQQGIRAYLAAPGGFEAPTVLGSCATVTREGLGGTEGRGEPLASGGTLRFAGGIISAREVPEALRPIWTPTPLLELILGAQHAAFSGTSLFDVFNQPWTVDSRADRMGIRLLGPALDYQGTPMISEGIPLGAVQVPPDGQPIVLLSDRQTIGGYPRLGALSPLALARLAQCMPGATVRFAPVLQDDAWHAHQAYLTRWT